MTSIIVTVGPSSIDPFIVRNLIKAGADSFRINLSHSNKENLEKYFSILNKEGINPAIDTQGAQLRVIDTNLPENISIGEEINLYFSSQNNDSIDYSNPFILFNHPEVGLQVNKGDLMKIDFDGLALEITEIINEYKAKSVVVASGKVKINKAADIQSKVLDLAVLTEFDKYAIEYAISKGTKEIYASFISDSDQVQLLRSFLPEDTKIISKIETALGVSNVKEILKVSDKILIDRGDLSREISVPAIPLAVFNILKISEKFDKDVIVATNILDSMMKSNVPSRAEISDIFNHLSQGVSGIVLAAEVAIGSNPVSSTALIKYLIKFFENYRNGFHGIGKIEKPPKELIGNELYNWL